MKPKESKDNDSCWRSIKSDSDKKGRLNKLVENGQRRKNNLSKFLGTGQKQVSPNK